MKPATYVWKPYHYPIMKILWSFFLYAQRTHDKHQPMKCHHYIRVPTYTTFDGGGSENRNDLQIDEACNLCLEALSLSNHENFVIILFVCSKNPWKTPTHEMPLHKGPNLHHIWWWGQWKSKWSVEMMKPTTHVWKSSHCPNMKILWSFFLYAQRTHEKHQPMKCHYIRVPTYTTFDGGGGENQNDL